MEIADALRKFRAQKSNAAERGIPWKLTFHEWFTWWGEDLDRRGRGHDRLMMCRVADRGAYELGNIYKGYPLDNMKTAGNMKRLNNGMRARREIDRAIDAAPLVSKEWRDWLPDDEWEMRKFSLPRSSFRMVSTRFK